MRLATIVAIAAIAAPAAAQGPVSPVRLNQLGFEPAAAKRAIAPNASRTPVRWRLVDARGRTRAQGATRVAGDDAASGEHVHQVDLSDFGAAGDGYRLQVGGAESRPFRIGARPYARLKYDALAYFYHNRSGVPIEASLVGERWARPAGHAPDRATCFAGADQQGNRWEGCGYTLDATGGWYDAGDHGKYVVNGGIALWTLLNAYERAQIRRTADAFADGRAAIPERGNGVNDLLDEARWQLKFMLAMQVPQGARLQAPVGPQARGAKPNLQAIDASGMAHHKLADERWTALPTAPHEDRMTRFLYPPSTAATLNLAATAAQCARIWRTIDTAFSAQCLTAAERAFTAARRNPEVYAWNSFDGSGGYGDARVDDEFYWAAAELFATTGRAEYETFLRALPLFLTAPAADALGTGDIAWPQVGALGTITLALTPNRLPPADLSRARANLVRAADGYLAQAEREGYRIPYSVPGYPWGSNSSLLNRAVVLALAHDFTGRRGYRDGVVDVMDYILGRNPLDQSYVSGYGARPMRHPHHRFWAGQGRYPPPPPGALSGGPNDTAMSDPVARTMRGTCRPQTCWRDHIDAFTLNEVAVNWNAPLVWVTAYLDEGGE